MTRLSRKSETGQLFGRGKNIALPGHERSTERGVKKVFLLELPGRHFTHRRKMNACLILQRVDVLPWHALLGRSGSNGNPGHGEIAFPSRGRRPLRIQSSYETILNFVRIAQKVALIEVQHVGKIIDTSHEPVNGARLDHMLPLTAQKIFIENFL